MWNDVSASLKISFYKRFFRAFLAEMRNIQAALPRGLNTSTRIYPPVISGSSTLNYVISLLYLLSHVARISEANPMTDSNKSPL